MDKCEKNDIKSNFFQVGISSGRQDCHYKIDSEPIQNLLLRIHQRGHAIGFHPSYKSSFNQSMFEKEASLFHEICKKKLNLKQSEWVGVCII